MNMCLTLANVFLRALEHGSGDDLFYHNRFLIFTVPIVLLITLKYSLTIEGASDGDPVEVLLHDKILLMLVILYLAVMLGILYI